MRIWTQPNTFKTKSKKLYFSAKSIYSIDIFHIILRLEETANTVIESDLQIIFNIEPQNFTLSIKT